MQKRFVNPERRDNPYVIVSNSESKPFEDRVEAVKEHAKALVKRARVVELVKGLLDKNEWSVDALTEEVCEQFCKDHDSDNLFDAAWIRAVANILKEERMEGKRTLH